MNTTADLTLVVSPSTVHSTIVGSSNNNTSNISSITTSSDSCSTTTITTSTTNTPSQTTHITSTTASISNNSLTSHNKPEGSRIIPLSTNVNESQLGKLNLYESKTNTTSSTGGANSDTIVNESTKVTTSTNITTQTTNTTTTTTANPKESLTDTVASGTNEIHRPHTSNNHDFGNLSKTNLYIKGLQSETTDQDLYNMCSRFGNISSTKAILDYSTRTCRGYGFVEFTSPQSAKAAVQELTKSGVQAQMAKLSPLYNSHHQHHHNHHHNNNNHANNNSNTSTHNSSSSYNHGLHQGQHSNNSQNNADPTNLYIANLPPNMSEQELENLLWTYGPVVSTRILRNQNNVPLGVGFARMESRDKCEQIIEQLNGRLCKGWKEPLLVKYADGGNKKRHHHHNHNNQHQNNSLHQHRKVQQYDNRWRDNNNGSGLSSGVTSYDHQGNIPHGNHLSDLSMMNTMSYPRMQPQFPRTVATGAYPTPHSMGASTSAPQWMHPSGQPYVLSQQMIQADGMGRSNQPPMHFGHIPQLTSQMQALQIGHPEATVSGYLPPQHQWPGLWTHPIPPQAQPSIRMGNSRIQSLPSAQQSKSPQSTPVQQSQSSQKIED